MQFLIVSLFAALAATTCAIPTGNTFIRASCDIAGCVAALAPSVVSCTAAVAEAGANPLADAACLASAANAGINFPPDCADCAEEFHVAEKAKNAGKVVVDEAKDVGNKAVDAGEKVVDGAKDVGGKVVDGAKDLGGKAVDAAEGTADQVGKFFDSVF